MSKLNREGVLIGVLATLAVISILYLAYRVGQSSVVSDCRNFGVFMLPPDQGLKCRIVSKSDVPR